MNYTELKANIQDICETSFTDDQLAMFTEQAEQKIYNTVQIPALRKNVTGALTTGSQYLTAPTDWLYVYSIAIINASGKYTYLINKDVNFIREAYPVEGTNGVPKHYATFDDGHYIVGPSPDIDYNVELHYGYYPESIVTAGTTWLGEEFDSALLNGALLEASRFLKSEADVIQNNEKMYLQSIQLLKTLGDGKLRQDTYRSGQVRMPVS